MPVFDASDAGGDRLSDRTRRIRMHGHIGAPILCRLDRGTYFHLGVLGRFDWIVGRADAAAPHQLDLARALPQLLPRSQANLIGAVGDGCYPLDLGVAQWSSERARNLEKKAKISMTRGLGN